MARQGKNIYKRNDGRWEGRYIKSTNNGDRCYGYIYGKTYDETAEKLLHCEMIMHEETDDIITFGELSAVWMATQSAGLKESSIAKYRNILSIHLIPRFGNRQVHTIHRSDIIEFTSLLLESGNNNQTGLAPKTVNSILSVMKNILQYASQERNIPVADLRNTSVRQAPKPMRILSPLEQQRLSKHLKEQMSPCNLGILICLYTGLRIGEICALQWKDYSADEGSIFVQRAMQRVQVQTGKRKTVVIIQSPKSACSIRKIPLPQELILLLNKEKKGDSAYILTGEEDRTMEPRCLENRFHAIATKCGIEAVTFHSIRHSFATRCVELGFDIKSLSEILGHASVNITLNRYVHPSMELKRKNMNMLSELLTTF